RLGELQATRQNAVLGCSALKQSYRDLLREGIDERLVYLKGSYDFIAGRIRARKGHFADEHILAGQFRDLQEPQDAMVVDVAPPAEKIFEEILAKLGL